MIARSRSRGRNDGDSWMTKKSNGPLQIDISPDQFTVTPTQAITIAGTRFTVPVRYAEGHVLTAGEANALNQTYLENCRNNLSGRAKDGTLTQEIVDQYAACVGWGNLLRQRHLRLKGPGQKTGI